MNKVCASILIFVALFALVGAEEDFMRIPLSQGVLRMRNLATATLPQYTLNNYTNLSAVTVSLGSDWYTRMNLPNTTETDMLLFLFTNVTGFCYDCNEFQRIGCNYPTISSYNNCSADASQPQSMLSPYYQVTTGYPFNFSNLSIGTNNATAAWKLNTTALLSSSYTQGTINTGASGISYYFPRNTSTYGYIGLGVGGNASKNFQTTTPIFSIQINSTGSGSVIFGKDTTLYDSKRTAMTLTTDTNWTMTSRNMSWGTVNNTNMISNVIFDLQHPGIGLPNPYYDTILTTFQAKYNFTTRDSSYGNSDYLNIYNGSLSNLPELVIGLTNGKNLTIPPSGYTRQLATNIYALLVYNAPTVTNRTSGQDVNYTVLGWPVLSQFYSVFELPTTGVPTITLYPTFNATANGVSDTTSSSFSLKTLAIVAAVVLVVLVALSAICKKKQDFTKSDLGVELRAARV